MKHTILLIVIMILFSCKNENKTKAEAATTVIKTETNIKTKVLTEAVLAGGQLQRVDSFPSKYVVPRTVDIWLPENYSEEKKYSVLYMHDGQNLFDATTTWNAQEWMVDEIASKLMKEEKVEDFIVIGLHNISDIRFLDYYPKKTLDYLPQKVLDSIIEDANKRGFNITLDNFKGDDYLKFIVEEVKPFVDATYSTKTDYNNTFVSGSSMGGLISMYAICEYPEVFGGAACISTHWPGMNVVPDNPMPNAMFSYLNDKLPSPKTHKLYFDFGTETLDQNYPQYEERVNDIFKNKGYTEDNFRNLKFEGHDHSENSWQKRFDIPLTYLLGK